MVRPGGGIDMLVTFPLGSAQMTPRAQAEARAFAQAMSAPQMAAMRFAIEGHTDDVGDDASNLALSEQRAAAVKTYLVETFQIATVRLDTAGFGESKPVAPNTSPEARQQNRRVEVKVVPAEAQ